MVGDRVGCEVICLDRGRHEGPSTLRSLDPKEAAGPAEVDQIDGHPQLRRQPTPRIEQRDGVERPVEQNRDVDGAVGAGSPRGMAALEPYPQQPAVGERRGKLTVEEVGKSIERNHNA